MIRLKRGSALVAIGVAAALLAGCGPGTPVVETEPPVVTVSQPLERKDIIDYDQYTGRVEAAETVEVRARVKGELVKIHFKDGALVNAGDPLFDLDPRTYKTDVDVALGKESQRRRSQPEVRRSRVPTQLETGCDRCRGREATVESWLARKGIATAEVHQAEAEIERAKLRCQLHADQRADHRQDQPPSGDGWEPRQRRRRAHTLLTTIVSVDPIFVYFDVDENSREALPRALRKEGGRAPKPRTGRRSSRFPWAWSARTTTRSVRESSTSLRIGSNSATGTIQVRRSSPTRTGN